jgi:hypothetical protein
MEDEDMSIFANAKDRLMEQGALSYLNAKVLGSFGRATGLRIDSNAKSINIELELKGEAVPVKIEIMDYEILNEAGHYFLLVRRVQTSREWLTVLANTRLCGRRFEVPDQAGPWLARML